MAIRDIVARVISENDVKTEVSFLNRRSVITSSLSYLDNETGYMKNDRKIVKPNTIAICNQFVMMKSEY